MRLGALRLALDLLNEARGHRRGRQLLRSRARRGPLRARRLPLPAEQRPDRARPARTSRSPRRALGPALRPAPLEHPFVALALLAPPARLRGRARGHRARAPARRGRERSAHDRRRVLPGFARRRPRGPLGARAQLRRARTLCLRGALRQDPRRPADEQPRRPQLPARQPRPGDRAAEGSVRIALDTGRDADAAQAVSSLAQIHLAPATSSRPRSRRVTRCASSRPPATRTTSTRSAARSSCSAARCSSRTGSTRRRTSFHAAEACFDQLGSASHRAAAWVARGDLAARRGDDRLAAHLFRTAAEALQDVRF